MFGFLYSLITLGLTLGGLCGMSLSFLEQLRLLPELGQAQVDVRIWAIGYLIFSKIKLKYLDFSETIFFTLAFLIEGGGSRSDVLFCLRL